MSTNTIKEMLDMEVKRLRQEVEAHLSAYPMGRTYFGMKGLRNPQFVKRLKDPKNSFELQTIRKARAFMRAREDHEKSGATSPMKWDALKDYR